jgi:NAD(P)-dependent dehydrogenase (short-subunit alcohol dehydrogenase family)
MPMSIDLDGARAVVTGTSSGLGAAIAASLAQAGCAVAGCGLEAADSAGAQGFLAQGRAAGRQAEYQQRDVADPAAARAFVAWAAETLGGVDFVVSNAGRNVFRGAAECIDEDWQANAEVNLAAHWRVAQAAKPHLDKSTRPVVIVISSNHSRYTMPGCFPYNVAKAGAVAIVQSLAIEWGPHIRAVGIAPGFMDTPLAQAWFDGHDDPAGKRAQIEGLHPAGRMGRPEEIGALCAYLCSPLAGFITGTTILVDGGRDALMQDV